LGRCKNGGGTNQQGYEGKFQHHWDQYKGGWFRIARNFGVIDMYYKQIIVRAVAVLVLTAASWWSVTLARADAAFRKQMPEAVAEAAGLAPRNAGYLIAQAIQTEYTGGDPTPFLERAAQLNPLSSAPRIRLGLAAEIRGDMVRAEYWLQEAASVDRQFETRWTLANFYFRQERADLFWQWIRSALEMSYGDRRLAFDLCSRISADTSEILTRAIPERREVIGAYLAYLIDKPVDKREVSAIAPVAMKLAANHTSDDLPLLYASTDALIYGAHTGGEMEAAADLWQRLGYPRPSGVGNPDFATQPVSHGFDWRILAQPGVTHSPLDGPAGHRIRLNGQQPESVELLRQVVGGLRSGGLYTLRWEARTQGFPAHTGLEWRIAGTSATVAPSDDWSGGELSFVADSDHAVLVLAYRRPEGEVRAEGIVDLRRVTSSRE
jgi:hypothetical protein